VICFRKFKILYFKILDEKLELIKKVEEFLGPRNWIEEWKIRENGKTENQRKLEKELCYSIKDEKWGKCSEIMENGVSFDFVDSDGYGTFYWLLYQAIDSNNSVAKEILNQIEENEKIGHIEKQWAIFMIRENYGGAAIVINWRNKIGFGTEIVTKSKRPIFNTIMMMGEYNWEEEFTILIIDQISNFEVIFVTDLNYIKHQKLEQNVKGSLPKFIIIAKRKCSNIDELVERVFSNKYFHQSEPLIWKFKIGKIQKYVCSYFHDLKISEDVILYLENGKVRYKSKTDVFPRNIEILEVENYLKEKLNGNLEIKMSQLLGLGGESIVIRKMINIAGMDKEFALRISNYENSAKMTKKVKMFEGHYTDTYDNDRFGDGVGIDIIDPEAVYKSENVKEMEIKNINHKNIIKYVDHTFEVIDSILCHITGK